MRIARVLGLASKACFVVFALLTSWYCVLAYLPFTYHQVHQGGLLPWLNTFARSHAALHLVALGILLPELWKHLRGPGRSRWLAISFVAFEGMQAVAEWAHPLLPSLADDRTSLVVSFVPLLSLLWLAAIDIAGTKWPEWSRQPASRDGRLFRAALSAGVCTAFLSLVIVATHSVALINARTIIVSLASHVAVVLIGFLLLNWVAAFANCRTHSGLYEFVLVHAAGAVVMAAAIKIVAAPPIGLQGSPAWCIAIAMGITVAASHAGIALALSTSAPGGLDAAVAPFRAVGPWLTLGVVCVLWPLLSIRLAAMDWNFLMQKLAAAAVWGLLLGVFVALTPRSTRRGAPAAAYVAGVLLLLGAYRSLQSAVLDDPALTVYAGYNVSYQLTRDIFSVGGKTESGFYRFLARNTNIGHSVPVKPVEQNLVEHLTSSRGAKPDIFLFTFDSLRRDYLSPYNASVTFTPEIARFAAESTVFKTAFTHYGGTGLSEPSIWAGSLLLHKQYVTPFAPMNTLEKLLRANDYARFVTRDTILAALSPTPEPGDLDRQRSGMDYDFCSSVEELASRLDSRHSDMQPVFAYTQPQNLHISVIQRENASVPGGKTYAGFYAPYAARLERMDGCFGKFIRHLKETGRYERSVIILTADHGDSLGEEGRWGHAYTIFPEVIRIPLIVHLPPSFSSAVSADPGTLAFSTDISPTLYYLLGNRSLSRSDLFGRPLFTSRIDERNMNAAAKHLIASSYAPVYGTLTGDGRTLYIADGVNGRDYLFDVKDSTTRSLPLSEALKESNRASIREWIDRINRVYGFNLGAGQ